MLQRSHTYAVVLACGIVTLASLTASADDKKALTGTWAKKDAEVKIEFVDKETLKIAPHGDAAIFSIECSYTIDKDGIVKAKITGIEGKEEVKKKAKGSLPVGFKFSFKWKVKDGTAKLEEVEGKDTERFKTHLEGDFEKK